MSQTQGHGMLERNQAKVDVISPEVDTEDEEQLEEFELFWRDHEEFLKAAGYILRQRYHPGWLPSWVTDTSQKEFSAEDKMLPMEASLLDATRKSDGAPVMLKRVYVERHPAELAIATHFSFEPLASDPRNHCIPIYEVIQLPENSECAIIVMPFLQRFDQPSFVCLGEIVDFLQQLLEGLQFMHQQNIAHCDVKINNIMSDTLRLYQVPPHPLSRFRGFTGKGRPILMSNSSRLQKSVKHYLVDFGLSHLHPPGSPRLQRPGYGGNWRSVPEFQNNPTAEPCDPFPVDVYCMGDFIRKRFRQGDQFSTAFQGLDFLDELIADMVQTEPKARPTMDEVVERFTHIVGGLGKWKLMSRASTVDETKSERIIKSVKYWFGLF